MDELAKAAEDLKNARIQEALVKLSKLMRVAEDLGVPKDAITILLIPDPATGELRLSVNVREDYKSETVLEKLRDSFKPEPPGVLHA